MIDPWSIAALTGIAVLTGFIDAIAGGGGLIMMPALLFAGVPPIEALGTNKLQSMFGTATAFRNFASKRLVDWRQHKGTVALVFAGASIGVIAVQSIDAGALRLIIPLLPFYGEHFHASPATVGLLMATYSLAQLFAAPWWGRLSDDHGRKPVLAISMVGAAASYVLLAFADTLAGGIVESRGTPPADFTSPRRRLQTALGKVLGEHMGLMVNTMQAGVLGRPDFRASGATLNANTTELALAIGALYGRPNGQRFLGLWAQHVDALTAYTAATARGDRPLDDVVITSVEVQRS